MFRRHLNPSRVGCSALLVTAVLFGLIASSGAPASGSSSAPVVGLRHSTSSNWSGYAAFGKTFSAVSGAWKQPAVVCGSQATYSAYWVGLDGYNDNSVEQLGTEADCSGGTARYYSWYEMYPHRGYYASVTVTPGHSYAAAVTSNGRGVFTLQLTDTTTGQSFTIDQKLSSARRSSAEVILEAPSGGGVLPLANFGVAAFSASYATANGVRSPLGSLSPLDPMTMVDPHGGTATPSAFDHSNTAFTVAYSAS